MPQINTLQTSWETLPPILPIGGSGVDLATNRGSLGPRFLARSENLRNDAVVCERRQGGKKLVRLVSTGASKTFGADGKYALIPAHEKMVIPAGGFGIRASGTAVRGAGTTFMLGARPNGQTFHVLAIKLTSAGALIVTWRDSTGSDQAITATVLADGASFHLFAAYDAVAGTFTLYVNGASDGTPITGLASTLTPNTTAGVVWSIGIEKESGAAVTAGSGWLGKIDALTLFSFAGMRPAVDRGDATLIETIVKFSRQQWPNPTQDMVVFNYDLDGSSLTTLTDSSNVQNDAAVTGTPTDTAEVAYLAAPCQCISRHEDMTGALFNIVEQGGTFSYQQIRGGA